MHSYTELDPEIKKALQDLSHAQAEEELQALLSELKRASADIAQAGAPDKPGRTGRYPGGKLTASDEGELRYQIGVFEGKVVLNFGGPVQGLGFSPDQALYLSDLLRKHAKSLLPKKSHNGKNRAGKK